MCPQFHPANGTLIGPPLTCHIFRYKGVASGACRRSSSLGNPCPYKTSSRTPAELRSRRLTSVPRLYVARHVFLRDIVNLEAYLS